MFYYITWFLIGLLYAPVFYQLYNSRWESIDYTHAYFILPVSLWLVWRKRGLLGDFFASSRPQRVSSIISRPYWPDVGILVTILTGLGMFIFGWRQEYLSIMTLSMLPFLWGTTRYLYGGATAKAVTFPIGYLIFLVPPPLGIIDEITIPLRFFISTLTELILRSFGYPITRDGLLLSIGGNEIFMGAPCSGFRSLITMFALAIIYVYFLKLSFLKKLILVACVIPLALLGNLIRVISLCLVTHHISKEAAEGFYHDFSGAAIFVIMIAGLMGIEHLMNKKSRKQDPLS